MELIDCQWTVLEPLIPPSPSRWPGRPCGEVLKGILWVLRTGSPWKDLPDRYPPYQTCHRRFQQWVREGVLEKALHTLAQDLRDRGGLDLHEAFIDGSFVPAKKRGGQIGRTKRGKGTKIMAVANSDGLPLAVGTASAGPHEVTLVQDTLAQRFVADLPPCLIGDKAYDSDTLDQKLEASQGVELIAPHKRNRVKAKTQDGRKLRRYKRRWKFERLFAWLQNFRRLVVRYEYHAQKFLGMLRLACIKILLRYLLRWVLVNFAEQSRSNK